jgi:hypothetical protein
VLVKFVFVSWTTALLLLSRKQPTYPSVLYVFVVCLDTFLEEYQAILVLGFLFLNSYGLIAESGASIREANLSL